MANKVINLLLKVNPKGSSKIIKTSMSKAILHNTLIRLIVLINHTNLTITRNTLALLTTLKIIPTILHQDRHKTGFLSEAEACNSSSRDLVRSLVALKDKWDLITTSNCVTKRQILLPL